MKASALCHLPPSFPAWPREGEQPACPGPLCSQTLWLPHSTSPNTATVPQPRPHDLPLPALSLGWEALTEELRARRVPRGCRSCCSLSGPVKRTWPQTPRSTIGLRTYRSTNRTAHGGAMGRKHRAGGQQGLDLTQPSGLSALERPTPSGLLSCPTCPSPRCKQWPQPSRRN